MHQFSYQPLEADAVSSTLNALSPFSADGRTYSLDPSLNMTSSGKPDNRAMATI